MHTCFKAKLINDCLNVFGNLIALAVSEEQVFELLTCNSTLNKFLIKVRKNIMSLPFGAGRSIFCSRWAARGLWWCRR